MNYKEKVSDPFSPKRQLLSSLVSFSFPTNNVFEDTISKSCISICEYTMKDSSYILIIQASAVYDSLALSLFSRFLNTWRTRRIEIYIYIYIYMCLHISCIYTLIISNNFTSRIGLGTKKPKIVSVKGHSS